MKFNKSTPETETTGKPTSNYEGGIAFTMDSETELYTRVMTCLMKEQKFYKEVDETGAVLADNQDDLMLQLARAVGKANPKFLLQLAAYARNEMYLRSTPVALLVEAAGITECKPFLANAAPRIIRRADEPAEALAYFIAKHGQIGAQGKASLPHALMRGIANSMHRFKAYHLAKYNRKGAVVKLKDVLRLVHAKPVNEEESALWKALLDDSLPVPETWETIITTGSNKENWTRAMGVMPYMALLRNLRNLLENEVDMRAALAMIADPEQVRKSKQLPFRFYSAYRMIESNNSLYASKTLDAIEAAMEASMDNIPRLHGATAIFADNSGSMDGKSISAKSTITLRNIANLFLAMSHKLCEFPLTGCFGTNLIVFGLPQRGGILQNLKSVDGYGGQVGGATYGYKTINYLNANKIKVDRIILFSDMQLYNEGSDGIYRGGEDGDNFFRELRMYRENVPDVYLYSVDLAGYGTTQVPEHDKRTALIAGWSDRILQYIPAFEEDRKTAIERIKKYELEQFSGRDGHRDEEED